MMIDLFYNRTFNELICLEYSSVTVYNHSKLKHITVALIQHWYASLCIPEYMGTPT